MELVQELFMTAFVAIIFSFVVAKLVSIAMAGDVVERDLPLKSSEFVVDSEIVAEEVKLTSGLRVGGTKSKERVQFVEGIVTQIDEFKSKISAENVEVKSHGREFGEICCESEEVCDTSAAVRIEGNEEEDSGEVSQGIGFSEKPFEGRSDVEGFGVDIVGGLESRAKEENIRSGLDELALEEKSECTIEAAADQFDYSVKEEIILATGSDNLIVEEKNIECAKRDNEINVESGSDVVVVDQSEKAQIVEAGENQRSGVEEREGLGIEEDDDWEGIERSELEQFFAAAAKYVSNNDDWLANLRSDVQMQLYGLHKVAMEGPCHEPQPMALKVSARVKWVDRCYV
ncbi:unnamed protein product [Ilex paraguariensis]|uniref:ACB domain-containing protein n=1 Tax=Ilex paraguariensis TaxID=185542 RepID=A0ABC8SEP5_9AQUA